MPTLPDVLDRSNRHFSHVFSFIVQPQVIGLAEVFGEHDITAALVHLRIQKAPSV
jgi:hypothetical protein